MIIFDGKYEWDGKKRSSSPPISWWPGSYRLRIVDLKDLMPDVLHIKPYVCILSDTGHGYSIKNTFEKFAIAVCRDFNLDVDKVLWIENFPGKDKAMCAAMVTPVGAVGGETLYSTTWRPVRPNELQLLNTYLTEH